MRSDLRGSDSGGGILEINALSDFLLLMASVISDTMSFFNHQATAKSGGSYNVDLLGTESPKMANSANARPRNLILTFDDHGLGYP